MLANFLAVFRCRRHSNHYFGFRELLNWLNNFLKVLSTLLIIQEVIFFTDYRSTGAIDLIDENIQSISYLSKVFIILTRQNHENLAIFFSSVILSFCFDFDQALSFKRTQWAKMRILSRPLIYVIVFYKAKTNEKMQCPFKKVYKMRDSLTVYYFLGFDWLIIDLL